MIEKGNPQEELNNLKEMKMMFTWIGIFIFPLFISIVGCAEHHEEDLVIFAIEFAVTEGKEKEARNYSDIMSTHVLNSEPETLTYEYYFTDDSKNMYLYEVYKNSDAATSHVKAFQQGPYLEEFFNLFELKSFVVMGNAKDDLKKSLEGFANDFRTLESGFRRK
tara:strand:+ start:51 stop:542 length:492 start_codon:yes stop_codon:yes gene_type:complete